MVSFYAVFIRSTFRCVRTRWMDDLTENAFVRGKAELADSECLQDVIILSIAIQSVRNCLISQRIICQVG
jgi:hypothetical protein